MKKSLDVLLLVDDKPGHYHLAEGVIAALARLVNVNVTRIEIQRRWLAPGRLLSHLVNSNASNSTILKTGYAIRLKDLPPTDLVISAGGDTLAANIAASRSLAAHNIFLGSLRRFSADDFNLVITSFERLAHLPRHLVSLKPSKLDPDLFAPVPTACVYGAGNPPEIAGLLLGGNTPDCKYTFDEWQKLTDFMDKTHQQCATRWLVSNSRRTPDSASDMIAAKAAQSDSPVEFIDYRSAGPGSLHSIFAASNIILCTADSSTMISEAIAARLPVIGLTPKIHKFTPQEEEYRQYLQQNNWTRSLDLVELSLEKLNQALSQILPMKDNHLDLLADRLKQRLPDLLS